MPKQVDHEERRRQITDAVARLATGRGLQGVSFREVAAEAGVSAALVQHYFGTKENLLVATLDRRSAAMAQRILGRLDALGPDARPLERLRSVATAFLPTDDESRAAMLLYHGFSAAALTDAGLRSAEAFRNGRGLLDILAALLGEGCDAGEVATDVDPAVEASALLSLVLGLSLTVLLDQVDVDHAEAAIDAHLARLGSG